jgi:hypothetical protein
LMQMAGRAERRPRRRPVAVALIALVLQLALATSALALTWGPTKPLTLSRNASVWDSLVVTGTSRVHVAYQEARGGILAVYYRRSIDAGTSWNTPQRLSRASATRASAPNLSAYGSTIDAVYVEARGTAAIVYYRQSTNNGTTWSPAVQISRTDGYADFAQVMRDASGRVLVTWSDARNGRVYYRQNIHGGGTFASTVSLGTTTNKPYGGSFLEAFPAVAAGSGVHYLAWYADARTLKVRRSTNGGSTWGTAVTVASDGSGFHLDLAASGSTALLGYARLTSTDIYPVIRRTADKGAHWSSAIALSPASQPFAFQPLISFRSSVWRAVFERCTTDACTASRTYYRQSTNGGVTWSSTAQASSSTRPFVYPGGVGFAGKLVVLLGDYKADVDDGDVYVRAGS